MRGLKIGLIFSCVILPLLYQKIGYAIDNTPLWQGVDFDFSQPGARSRGIGSAFVGAADDATAAVTNPAGLVQLPEMQATLEGHTIAKESSDIEWGGNTSGSIRNEDKTEVSFFCFSTPVKLFKDFSINTAIFYNKLSSLGSNIDLPKFQDKLKYRGFEDSDINATFPEYSSKIDLALDEFGTSFGLGLLDGKLMLGAGVSVLYLNVESEYGQSSPQIADVLLDPSFEDMKEKVDVNDDDYAFAFRGGLLYSPVKKLTIGASARIMPEMDYETKYHIIKDTNLDGELTATVLDTEISQKLKIPDVYSLGLSYRITDKFTFFAEGKYIAYSDMMDDFDAIWRGPYAYGGKDESGRYDINDIIEPHIGAEYVFMLKDTTPLAVRCGSYYEPAHGLEFEASLTDPNVESVEAAKALENLMDGGEDLWHVTIGLGTVIKKKYQIDAAADLTESAARNTFILSTAYIF